MTDPVTNRRLRIQHIEVRPVLVWDDGKELTPGPTLQGLALPLSAVSEFIESLPDEVARLAEQAEPQL